MKKIYIVVLILILCIITVIGCGTPATTPAKPTTTTPTTTATTPTTQAPQPQYGGLFRQLATSGPVNVGDPAIVPGAPTFYAPAGESLHYTDKQGNMVPCLATSWEFSPDGKFVTFKLRKGVKFQDGTDFNAEAVKFCLDRGIKGQAPGLKPVTSVDVIDEYTVRVNWPKFDYSVWDSLGGQRSPSWMVSPTSIKTHDADWPRLNMVGTGAFKYISYQRDVGIKYEKFDGYWQKGLPYLDRVEFVLVADAVTALMAFKGGAAELIGGLSVVNATDLKKDGRFSVFQTPGMSSFLAPSSKNAGSPFSDIRVRRAVCHAIDTKMLAEGIGGGYYLPSNQAFPPWMWAHNTAVKGYPYDPAKAKQLLTEAGYATGFKTTIFMTSGPSQDMQVAVQSYLKAVGIDANIQALTGPAIAAMLAENGWEGLMTGSLLTIVGMDPGALMQGMGFVNRGPYYVGVMRKDDTLALLDKANGEVDINKRKPMLLELSRLIMDEYCMVCPLYYTQGLVAIQPNVRDIGIGDFRYTYEKAWLSK